MKANLRILLIGLFFITSINLISQNINNVELVKGNRVLGVNERETKTEGSNYIPKNYAPAKVNNSTVLYMMRYDAHNDEMEFEKDGVAYHLPKDKFYRINFTTNNKTYELFIDNQTNTKGFYVVLNQGSKISLLVKEYIKFYEEKPTKGPIEPYQPPRYKRSSDKLYIGYANNTALELTKKKKDFFALFGDNSKTMQTYVKENKLNIKKQKDLIQIFEHYNTL
jgi:hypothetical protein